MAEDYHDVIRINRAGMIHFHRVALHRDHLICPDAMDVRVGDVIVGAHPHVVVQILQYGVPGEEGSYLKVLLGRPPA